MEAASTFSLEIIMIYYPQTRSMYRKYMDFLRSPTSSKQSAREFWNELDRELVLEGSLVSAVLIGHFQTVLWVPDLHGDETVVW